MPVTNWAEDGLSLAGFKNLMAATPSKMMEKFYKEFVFEDED